jgi:hypothetical protein
VQRERVFRCAKHRGCVEQRNQAERDQQTQHGGLRGSEWGGKRGAHSRRS